MKCRWRYFSSPVDQLVESQCVSIVVFIVSLQPFFVYWVIFGAIVTVDYNRSRSENKNFHKKQSSMSGNWEESTIVEENISEQKLISSAPHALFVYTVSNELVSIVFC